MKILPWGVGAESLGSQTVKYHLHNSWHLLTTFIQVWPSELLSFVMCQTCDMLLTKLCETVRSYTNMNCNSSTRVHSSFISIYLASFSGLCSFVQTAWLTRLLLSCCLTFVPTQSDLLKKSLIRSALIHKLSGLHHSVLSFVQSVIFLHWSFKMSDLKISLILRWN